MLELLSWIRWIILNLIVIPIFIPFCLVLETGRVSVQIVFVLFFLFVPSHTTIGVTISAVTFSVLCPFIVIALVISAIRMVHWYPDVVQTLKCAVTNKE